MAANRGIGIKMPKRVLALSVGCRTAFATLVIAPSLITRDVLGTNYGLGHCLI